VQRYQSRISGPLLDRIDLHVPVPELDQQTMLKTRSENPEKSRGMGWEEARQTIILARQRQTARQGCLNAYVNGSELTRRIQRADLDASFLSRVTENFELSLRNYHKLWRIALTLADLDRVRENPDVAGRCEPNDEQHVREHHMLDALNFRTMHLGGN
jgi:magnesium chelatase family protein